MACPNGTHSCVPSNGEKGDGSKGVTIKIGQADQTSLRGKNSTWSREWRRKDTGVQNGAW